MEQHRTEVYDVQPVVKKQIDIYEIWQVDGGVGLQFGDGPIHMGYDTADLMRLLKAVFPEGNTGEQIDGELYDLTHLYLDPDTATQRIADLRDDE